MCRGVCRGVCNGVLLAVAGVLYPVLYGDVETGDDVDVLLGCERIIQETSHFLHSLNGDKLLITDKYLHMDISYNIFWILFLANLFY